MHDSVMPKPTIVVWTDISPEQVNKLESLNDPESINNFFIKIFQLQSNTKRTTVLCDLFYYAFNFARTNKFNSEQISAFISILKCVHDMCIRTPFANMEETYQYFKALVLKHSLLRPPYSLRIFTPDVTKQVTNYIVNTYFRHFKMYKYVFTSTIDFTLKFTYEGMSQETPKTDEQNEEEKQETEQGEEQVQVEEKLIETEENPAPQQNNEEQQPVEQVQDNETKSQLDEIRKLIQSYVKDEFQRIQKTIQPEPPSLPPPTEKRRSAKSGGSKTPKTSK